MQMDPIASDEMPGASGSPRPILAVTMGDPSGVGPEIILKVLANEHVFAECRPLVIGDIRIFERAGAWVGQSPVFEIIEDPAAGCYLPGTVPIIDLADADPTACLVGEVSPASGKAAV
jgi:4-hydroxythreonine-4-phosphate dehydrogenase